MAQYTVELDVDASGAVTGLKNTGTAAKDAAAALGVYIDTQGRLREANGRFVASGSDTQKAFDRMTGAAGAASGAVTKMGGDASRSTRGLIAMGQVLNDSQQFAYGFRQGLIAVSNQIPQLIEMIGAAGKAGRVLQLSMGWISLALSAATTAFILFSGKTEKATDALREQAQQAAETRREIERLNGAVLGRKVFELDEDLDRMRRELAGFVAAREELERRGRTRVRTSATEQSITGETTRVNPAYQATLDGEARLRRSIQATQFTRDTADARASQSLEYRIGRLDAERARILAVAQAGDAASTRRLRQIDAETTRLRAQLNAVDPTENREERAGARASAAADRAAERAATKAERARLKAERQAERDVETAEAARARLVAETEAERRVAEARQALQGKAELAILVNRMHRAEEAADAERAAFGETALFRDLSLAAAEAENAVFAEQRRLRVETARDALEASRASHRAEAEAMEDRHALALAGIADEEERERQAIAFEAKERIATAKMVYAEAEQQARLIEDTAARQRAIDAAALAFARAIEDARRDEATKTAALRTKLAAKAQKEEEEAQEKLKQRAMEHLRALQDFVSASGEIASAVFDGGMAALDRLEAAELHRIDAELARIDAVAEARERAESRAKALADASTEAERQRLQEQFAAEDTRRRLVEQRAEVERRYERERAKAMREQAKREKALALFRIAIETAVGIVSVLKTPGGFLKGVAIAATGALQAAAVMAQPLPEVGPSGGGGAPRGAEASGFANRPGAQVGARSADVLAAQGARAGSSAMSRSDLDYLAARIGQSVKVVPVLRDRDAAAAARDGAFEATVLRGGALF